LKNGLRPKTHLQYRPDYIGTGNNTNYFPAYVPNDATEYGIPLYQMLTQEGDIGDSGFSNLLANMQEIVKGNFCLTVPGYTSIETEMIVGRGTVFLGYRSILDHNFKEWTPLKLLMTFMVHKSNPEDIRLYVCYKALELLFDFCYDSGYDIEARRVFLSILITDAVEKQIPVIIIDDLHELLFNEVPNAPMFGSIKQRRDYYYSYSLNDVKSYIATRNNIFPDRYNLSMYRVCGYGLDTYHSEYAPLDLIISSQFNREADKNGHRVSEIYAQALALAEHLYNDIVGTDESEEISEVEENEVV